MITRRYCDGGDHVGPVDVGIERSRAAKGGTHRTPIRAVVGRLVQQIRTKVERIRRRGILDHRWIDRSGIEPGGRTTAVTIEIRVDAESDEIEAAQYAPARRSPRAGLEIVVVHVQYIVESHHCRGGVAVIDMLPGAQPRPHLRPDILGTADYASR